MLSCLHPFRERIYTEFVCQCDNCLKKHKLSAKPLSAEPFDRTPVCFNVKQGVREKLKAIPDWKERLREFVDRLIEESGQTGSNE